MHSFSASLFGAQERRQSTAGEGRRERGGTTVAPGRLPVSRGRKNLRSRTEERGRIASEAEPGAERPSTARQPFGSQVWPKSMKRRLASLSAAALKSNEPLAQSLRAAVADQSGCGELHLARPTPDTSSEEARAPPFPSQAPLAHLTPRLANRLNKLNVVTWPGREERREEGAGGRERR